MVSEAASDSGVRGEEEERRREENSQLLARQTCSNGRRHILLGNSRFFKC